MSDVNRCKNVINKIVFIKIHTLYDKLYLKIL